MSIEPSSRYDPSTNMYILEFKVPKYKVYRLLANAAWDDLPGVTRADYSKLASAHYARETKSYKDGHKGVR